MRWRSVWSSAATSQSGTTVSAVICRLHRRAGGHQRRLRTRHPASPDAVLRGQVLSDLHPGRTRTGAPRRRRTARFGDLRLRLSVNGEERQNALVAGDMLYRPLQALQSLARFQDLAAGDLILTGTPVGTALSAPPKPIMMISNLLPPAVKWKAFFKSQADNPKYLHDGDRDRGIRAHRRRRDRPRHPADDGPLLVGLHLGQRPGADLVGLPGRHPEQAQKSSVTASAVVASSRSGWAASSDPCRGALPRRLPTPAPGRRW